MPTHAHLSRALMAIVALVLALGDRTGRAQVPPLVESFDMQVPSAPVPVSVSGQLHLVYELHLTNFTSDPLTLTRLDVLAPGRPAPLATFDGAQLAALLGTAGARLPGAERRTVNPGARTIVYFWLPLDGPAPATLAHRIHFDVLRAGNRRAAVVEGRTVAVSDHTAIVLDPPLKGGLWAAVYDPLMERGHRRVFYTLDGRARIPGRFAVDWFKVDRNGKVADGDSAPVDHWYGYGADVLAVADAVVASVRDGMPETAAPGSTGPPLGTGAGNFLSLDVGAGRFAFYEHLKPGSIQVKTGDRVRSGAVIASLGNSGQTSGPHLHFHVSDANTTLGAEGLPFVLRSFAAAGTFRTLSAFAEGGPFERLPGGSMRQYEMALPAANIVVEFPR